MTIFQRYSLHSKGRAYSEKLALRPVTISIIVFIYRSDLSREVDYMMECQKAKTLDEEVVAKKNC
jgi:hypothetical protein